MEHHRTTSATLRDGFEDVGGRREGGKEGEGGGKEGEGGGKEGKGGEGGTDGRKMEGGGMKVGRNSGHRIREESH